MADRLPWMPLDVGEHLAGTRHLTPEQDGAYLRLQMHYWRNGGLPNDDVQLASIVGLTVQRWRKIKSPITDFFGADWSSHERLDSDKDRSLRVQMQRKIAGAKGGFHSAVAKAKNHKYARASPEENAAANVVAVLQPPVTHSPSGDSSPKSSSSESVAARAREAETQPGGQQGKRPSEASRADLDAIIERNRTAFGAKVVR